MSSTRGAGQRLASVRIRQSDWRSEMTKRKSRRSRRPEPAPGWLWMLFGFSLGLVVAVAVYLSGSGSAATDGFESRSDQVVSVERPAVHTVQTEPGAERFDFYELLPQFEVVIPEVEVDATRKDSLQGIAEPGAYVLQVGSYTSLDDADGQQANLALLGVESRIQRVTIDDKVFHRVRVGPMTNLGELNRIRQQLRDAHIGPTLLIRTTE